MSKADTLMAFAKSVVSNPQALRMAVDTAHGALGETKIIGALTAAAKLAADSHANLSAISDTVRATTGIDLKEHATKHATTLFGAVGDTLRTASAKVNAMIEMHVSAGTAVDGPSTLADKARDIADKMKAHMADPMAAVKALAQGTGKTTSRA